MPGALPPVPVADWDAHHSDQLEATTQEARSLIAGARSAQESVDQAAEADFTQRAQAQVQDALAPVRQAQESVSFTAQAQEQIRALTRSVPQVQPYAGDTGSAPPASRRPDAPSGELQDYARAAAVKAGIDPETFVRQIQQESGFRTDARNPSGATGIAQIVPSAHPGVDPNDPRASLDYAANWMATLTKQYGGDKAKALAAYNAGPGNVEKYGGVPPFEETQRYVKIILGDGGDALGADSPAPGGGNAPTGLQTPAGGVKVEALGQFEQGLPPEDAYSICGPVAALAFARANGRNPDLGEARRLAKQVGWTSAGGMNGVQNQQKLLTEMGVASRLDTNPDFGQIAADAESGNPVIISTGVHFYFVNGYDKQTGQLHVGKTGEARKGGGSWMSAQQIATLDGGINGALFVDNPGSPTPSVGAEPALEEDTAELGPLGGPGGSRPTGAPVDDAPAGFAPIGAKPRAGFAPLHAPTGQIEPSLPGVTDAATAALVGQHDEARRNQTAMNAHFDMLVEKRQRGEQWTADDIGAAFDFVTPMSVGAIEPLGVGAVGKVVGKAAAAAGETLGDVVLREAGAAPTAPGISGGKLPSPAARSAADAVRARIQAAADAREAASLSAEDVRLLAGETRAARFEPPAPATAAQIDARVAARPLQDAGQAAPELGRGAQQGTLLDRDDLLRQPVDPGAPPPKAPGSSTPRVVEQAPLRLEVPPGKGPSKYDRVSLVRMAGMLSGVPTHLLNIAGNTVMGAATLGMKEGQVGADLLRVGIGRALGKDVARQRFQAEMGPQVAGYAKGVWAGMQQVPAILRHGATEAQLASVNAPTGGLQSGSKVVDAVVEAPLRALAASDAIFRTASFGGHSVALAVRQATQEGLSGAARTARVQEILGNISEHPRLLEAANNLAARDVFQEGRAVTDAISTFRREHMAANVAGDLILPFYKTPYNVAAQGAGMTPAGYLSVLHAARAGETGEAVDRVVRATVGTAALGVGLTMAASNTLTGPYPTDAAERSTLPEGWKPYSIRIPRGDGAVYVPIVALGAFAVPLGVAANMHEAQRRGAESGDVMKGVYAGMAGLGKFMLDASAFQGLIAVSKLATEPERSFEAFSESMAASAIPYSALMRNIQQALGDAQRDPEGPHEAFLAAIPGLSRFIPEKQTALGDTRRRGESGPAALVAGSRFGVELPDATLAALRSADVNIPEPKKTVGASDVRLTPAEQAEYRKIAGDMIRSSTAGMTGDAKFSAAPVAVRKKALEAMIARNRTTAETRMIERIGSAEMSRRVRAQQAASR